jgi:hypothetical protein
MAGKSQNALLPDGDEAGDRLPAKRYIDFAGPGLAEILSNPGDDLVLFRSERAPRRDGRLAQAAAAFLPGFGLCNIVVGWALVNLSTTFRW